MKSPQSSPVPRADSDPPRAGRRRLVVGAGLAAGAVVALAAVQRKAGPEAQVATTASDPTDAQGYRLTDHVRRYYETTRT